MSVTCIDITMSPKESITQLCKELNLDNLVSVCQRNVDKSLKDLQVEYRRRRNAKSEVNIEKIKKLLKPALGSSMDGANPNTIANIAMELSDILDLNKKPMSEPMTPNLTKAVRSLCTTINNYCFSEWDGGVLFSESSGNLITLSFCFYFTTDVIQVGSHGHQFPARSGELNKERFTGFKISTSPTRLIRTDREISMSLTMKNFMGFQLPVFSLPTDENTAYIESAWSSRLASTFLIPIFSFYQLKLRQEKLESISHFNTDVQKRPDFSVVSDGSVIASLSVNTNSLKDVTDDEILLSLEIKLGTTTNNLDGTVLLQFIANMAVTKTRVCLLPTPDTIFKVEYKGIKAHNGEKAVHLDVAKFLDKSVARCIFQQLRKGKDYRMKHNDHIELLDFIVKPQAIVASSSSHSPNSSNRESSKDEANTKKHHHQGSDALAKGKPSGPVDPGTAPPLRKQSKRGGETKGKGKKLEGFFAAFGEKLKITTKSTEEKENVSQTNEGKDTEIKKKEVRSGLSRRIFGPLEEKNTFTRVSKSLHWTHKGEYHSVPVTRTNSELLHD